MQVSREGWENMGLVLSTLSKICGGLERRGEGATLSLQGRNVDQVNILSKEVRPLLCM